MRCLHCQTPNSDVKFCMSCGTALTPVHLAGERRVVNVMFADIPGFTALAETMDPDMNER